MRRLGSYTLLMLLLAVQLRAQKGARTIVDAKTRQPLDYVSIQSDDNRIRLMSNKDGKFILIPDTSARAYSFYRIGYQKLRLSTGKLLGSDTVLMEQSQQLLQEVTVSGEKLQPIVKDKRFYVEDYCILPNNDFLLITSHSIADNFDVCYYSWDKGISYTKKIKGESAPHFVTDCFKNVHVITDQHSRQVFFDSDSSFQFLPKYRRQVFDSALANCMLKLDTQVIMKFMLPPTDVVLPDFTVKQNAPFMSYISVSKHARQPFYFMQYNARLREMIEHEVADFMMFGPITPSVQCNIMLFFRRIATPLYAPLFLRNDTVVLFDFQEYRIVFLNRAGSVLRQVSMDQDQFMTLRDFEILHDARAQKFYLKTRDADRSYIRRIDIYSGKTDKTIKLEKVFARNIQVANDRIYYLVREKGWDDTQYLYRQN